MNLKLYNSDNWIINSNYSGNIDHIITMKMLGSGYKFLTLDQSLGGD